MLLTTACPPLTRTDPLPSPATSIMQFTALILILALAHIGIGIGIASPAVRVQSRAQCVFECVNGAECVNSPRTLLRNDRGDKTGFLGGASSSVPYAG